MNGRIGLRTLEQVDESLYGHLYTDAETMRFIGPPLSAERAARSFRAALALTNRQPARQQLFAVVEIATQRAIGIGSLQGIDPQQRRVEVGIMIEAAARSHGYATEGLACLVQQAFRTLPVDEVQARIAATHTVVERLVISVGFSPHGDMAGDDGRELRLWRVHRGSWQASAKEKIAVSRQP
jgi:RimJ/RimL family protein N-acetyltransferase